MMIVQIRNGEVWVSERLYYGATAYAYVSSKYFGYKKRDSMPLSFICAEKALYNIQCLWEFHQPCWIHVQHERYTSDQVKPLFDKYNYYKKMFSNFANL